MRTTINIDDALLADAREFSGVAETAALVRLALRTFVELEASRRLAALGGSAPDAVAAPRQRPWAA